jgi:hypothetical protein
LPNIHSKDSKSTYKELSYWQFIQRIILDKKLRKEFFGFILKGFK